MPLESTMICLDNSEWMRNGDYVPTRMEAQHDAANLVCGAKTQSNPESTVGVLSMAGSGPELLVSPTDDMGKILSSLHNVKIGGSTHLASAIQIAQLALKHRRNKHGGQRLVIFIASPIKDEKKALNKVGKLLKKNSVAVDVVSMGEIEENREKLQELIDAANSGDNSHLITIQPGLLPSDVLISSPVVAGDSMGGDSYGDDMGGGFGGIDSSMDPELAMALRVSMEEERARQEAAALAASSDNKSHEVSEMSETVAMNDDEDALLQQALAMSMQDSSNMVQTPAVTVQEDMDIEEYEAMNAAIQMSFKGEDETIETRQEGYLDQNFVNQLLGQSNEDAENPEKNEGPKEPKADKNEKEDK